MAGPYSQKPLRIAKPGDCHKRVMGMLIKFAALLVAVLSTVPAVVFAEQPASVVTEAQDTAETAENSTESDSLPSPYSPSVEGGDSVTDDLAQEDLSVGGLLSAHPIRKFFSPWFDAKRSLNEKFGIKLQLSYQTLYQYAGDSPGKEEAAAGRAEIQGTWTLLGRGTKNPGLLSFRLEHRHRLGTEIPPTKLGGEFGSATPTGTGFSDFGSSLSELAWRQTLFDGTLKLAAGKISALSWYNFHALSSSKTGFQNTALQSSLSKPVPGRGIGGGFGVRLGSQFVAVAGIHDANARTPDSPFDTIDENEFYQSLELRWLLTNFERSRWDKVTLQLWHQDKRKDLGIKAGHGVTFAASRMFQDFWMPFVLGGVSDGDTSIFEADLIVGIGMGFHHRDGLPRDVLAFAIGWGKPSNALLQDQYTAEVFYRFPLFEKLVITPSAQLVINPAASPDEEAVLVLGARMRLTF